MDSFSHPTQRSGAIYKKYPSFRKKREKDGAHAARPGAARRECMDPSLGVLRAAKDSAASGWQWGKGGYWAGEGTRPYVAWKKSHRFAKAAKRMGHTPGLRG